MLFTIAKGLATTKWQALFCKSLGAIRGKNRLVEVKAKLLFELDSSLTQVAHTDITKPSVQLAIL